MLPSLYYVQVAIRALGFDVKKADVQKIMRDCDKDNTGKISLADFNEISMSLHLDSGLYLLDSIFTLKPLNNSSIM